LLIGLFRPSERTPQLLLFLGGGFLLRCSFLFGCHRFDSPIEICDLKKNRSVITYIELLEEKVKQKMKMRPVTRRVSCLARAKWNHDCAIRTTECDV
jgi:hypothetical protein